jgi:acetyl-CoA carboxylase biotin carboxyl carrier protein
MPTQVRAHITGNVWKILVKPGDTVATGDQLIIFESMKMEIPLEAEDPAKIVEVKVAEGQAVNEGDVVLVLQDA